MFAVEVAQPAQGVPPPQRPPPRALRRAEGRLVHDRARRDGRHPGPERLGQVDAGPPALDAAPPRRRHRARLRARRLHRAAAGAQARQPRVGRGVVLQEDVRGREPQLRGALLRHDGAARRASKIPEILDRVGFPADRRERADGEPLARHAAEGRARAGAAHVARPAAARRADDGPRPALEARGAEVHPRDPRDARGDDPALHARPRRGRGARRPGRDPRPRRAARARARGRAQGAVRRRDARGGVLRRHRPRRSRRRWTRTTWSGRCSHESPGRDDARRADRARRASSNGTSTSPSATSSGISRSSSGPSRTR